MRSIIQFLGFSIHLFYLLSNAQTPICHDHERSALLQFKQSFSTNQSASLKPNARQKLESWNVESQDCCSWEGVVCNTATGYVTGLNASSSFLYGSFNSTSTLFTLLHLRRLDLADNDFNFSQIPPEISRFSRLSHLNLSSSVFSGLVPVEILQLSNLVSLDLAINVNRQNSQPLLKLEPSTFLSLPHKLSRLQVLALGFVHINSTVPEAISDMSSLTNLTLQRCGLYGEFPKSIFLAPKLQAISLYLNRNLTGTLPEFPQGNPLRVLILSYTGFSGSLPASLANLTELATFQACFSNINEGSLSTLRTLTKIKVLCLTDMNLQGELPSFFANLTQLTSLVISKCKLTGEIPSWVFNMTQLIRLDLAYNSFHGQLTHSFSRLKNLEYLALQGNNFSGTVEASIFFNLKKLTTLNLSRNNLSFSINNTTTILPKFQLLALGNCNLREIPDFLQYQNDLQILALSNNMIRELPKWMWNKTKPTPGVTSNVGLRPVLPWDKLSILDLRNNFLEGPMPIPPPGITYIDLFNNSLTGKIPDIICSYKFLYVFDLSNNNMSGTIPPCLGNTSNSLVVMILKGNNFQGNIPPVCGKGSQLQTLDLSENQLQGPLPKSLANCEMLEILILENNQIEDSYPSWLGALSKLHVLILSSNKFHGTVSGPTTTSDFSKLRIIDLSNNALTGSMPKNYFLSWNAMRDGSLNLTYIQLVTTVFFGNDVLSGSYSYSMQITNKGVKREYEKILNIFTAVDLSSNKFTGEIPESIETLHGLQLLNISNNNMVGRIPSSIATLTRLESIDLSSNTFSGGIPPQFEQLSFLAFLNVSYNNLTGPIPQGRQFATFLNGSYRGNLDLCGDPLSRNCRSPAASIPPPSITDVDRGNSGFLNGVDWIVLFSGVGSGVVAGLIFGINRITKHHEWFVEKFGKWPKNWKSIRLLDKGKRRLDR